jgi:hypothetical protein
LRRALPNYGLKLRVIFSLKYLIEFSSNEHRSISRDLIPLIAQAEKQLQAIEGTCSELGLNRKKVKPQELWNSAQR